MGKIIYKCEFGIIHREGNCRCMNEHVTTRQVRCDIPDEHKGSHIQISEKTPTLRERLERTVDSFLGAMIMPVVREALVDQLEKDAKESMMDAWRKAVGD